jgi:hypothetical protein
MSKILNLALEMKERKLSFIIILDYDIKIEEQTIVNAVIKEDFDFLFLVWATNKNFIGSRNDLTSTLINYE